MFTNPDGNPYHPNVFTSRFQDLIAAGLPPVRLHDLRHGAASLANTKPPRPPPASYLPPPAQPARK
ncbi:hypothetical protein [Couchioplanes caeruleus]|uniref:hypothetical protein n=1 Tax=Couchioplanes caeruleus TaxID=56438 RepID=UPI00116066D8|nr:hypothetical protein [Couchioplanes caeruleus]